MKDTNRIAVLVGLGLLFAALLLVVPNIDFFRPLHHVSPWIFFALFWVFFWGCGGCRGRRCGRSRCHPEDPVAGTQA